MMAQDWAAVLAGCAALVQIAAAVFAVLLVRRHPASLPATVAVVVLVLMALRRALATAGWPFPGSTGGLAVTQEATGLGISLAIALTVVLLWRWPTAASVADTAPPTAAADEAASAREEERELLCYNLHDGLAQLVMGSRMHLDAFKAARGRNAERAERELGLMGECLEEAVAEVTRMIADLSLTVCPDVSLSEAIGQYLEKLSQTQRWRHELDDQLAGRRFDSAVEAMTFRLVQEALNNAAKHARTDRVRVSLGVESGSLVAAVRDWGRGFDPERAQWSAGRLGLRGMCGRARLVGGSCAIESAPGEGTTVTSRVPCCPDEKGER